MITFTTPFTVRSVLGSATTISYEKGIVGPFTMDPVNQTMHGTVRITSTSTPTAEPIIGNFRASVPGSEIVVNVPQLNATRRVQTSGAQNTALLNQIQSAQNAIESGLITVGICAGVQSTGA